MKREYQKLLIVISAATIVGLLGFSLAYLYLGQSQEFNSYISDEQTGPYTIEYSTEANSTTPNAIAVDSSGDVWFALWNDSSIAELIPSNGTIHQYHVPGMKDGSMITWGLAVDDLTHTVWFTDELTNAIWSFNMTSYQFVRHDLKTADAFPFGIAIDSNQDIWFTELGSSKIGEIAANGSMVELSIPSGGEPEPSGITVAPSGAVWFTMPGTNSVGSYQDGVFHIENLTGEITTPVGIAVDQSGNVWFTQHGPSFISEFNPTTHYLKTISTSNNSLIESLPYFCYVDAQGNIWFNEHQGNAEAEFSPVTNTLIEYFIPTRVPSMGNISYMLTSTLSPQGQPWYTEFMTGKVGTINTTKNIDVNLSLPSYTGPVSIPAYGNVSIALVLTSSTSVNMHAYVGNYTGNFSFTFSPQENTGSFKSTMNIQNNGSPKGVYFVTVTARTSYVAVSKIIELNET